MYLKNLLIGAAAAGCLSATGSAFASTVADVKAAVLAGPISPATTVTGTADDSPIVTQIISDTGTQSTFLLQDASGAIDVFRNNDSTYTPAVGDAVDITANSVSFHGLFEMESTFTSVTKISSGNSLPAKSVFTISNTESGSSAAVALQSTLGTLSGVTFVAGPSNTPTTGTFASNGTYTVSDGVTSGFTTIFVPSTDTALIGTAIPTGAVNIFGYLGQFDSAIGTAATGSTATSTNGIELDPLSFTPAATTPEPASLGLLSIGALVGLRRRRA
jgi:hypothetical protein